VLERGCARRAALGDRSRKVELGDRLRESLDRYTVQHAFVEQPVDGRMRIELDELHGVFDRGRAADLGRVRGPAYRPDVEIEIRGEAAIQLELRLAETSAAFECRKVEEWQSERLFQLICVRTGQQHVRDVRLDQLDRAGRMRVAGGIAQSTDEASGLVAGRRGAPVRAAIRRHASSLAGAGPAYPHRTRRRSLRLRMNARACCQKKTVERPRSRLFLYTLAGPKAAESASGDRRLECRKLRIAWLPPQDQGHRPRH